MTAFNPYKKTSATTAPKFQSDPNLSSFRWEIDLTQDGTNRVSMMEGYSKGQGFELTNKAELLIKKITNPLALYLAKSDEIRLYENLIEIPSGQSIRVPKHQQTLILTLYRTHYEAHSWVASLGPILSHLNQLYAILKATGKPPQERSTNSRKKVWFPELDHSKYRFATLEELHIFCHSMIEKHGAACMNKWWTAHLSMQPELAQPEPTGPTIVSTPASSPEQQQAQAAMQGLYTKFGQR